MEGVRRRGFIQFVHEINGPQYSGLVQDRRFCAVEIKPELKQFIHKANDLSNNFPFFRNGLWQENVIYRAHLAIHQALGGATRSR
ncbi:hypothetical protein CLM73_13985 [Achromobacter spanius]|uniref:Uncharacterized protein n=1 Tax=Achromobacter spanius TaxID=217203 RepID=A0A2S0I7X4_9BURK|nr:hypothetical protein CLM73_13985 [Achromobacter spanius]